MSTDLETFLTLAAASDRMSAVIDHVRFLPHAERSDAIETIQRGLTRPNAARLNYIWPLIRPRLPTPSHSPDRADALVHAITDLILDRNPIMIW